MSEFKEYIIEKCIDIFKDKNLQNELKKILKPVIFLLLNEIYPYIIFTFILVIISFLLILGIFLLLFRIYNFIKK